MFVCGKCNVTFQIWNCVIDEILPKLTASPPDVEALRIYLILPLYHEFNNPKQHLKLHKPFANGVLKLKPQANRVIGAWWGMTSRDYFEKLVIVFKVVVGFIIRNQKIPENKVSNFMKLVRQWCDVTVFFRPCFMMLVYMQCWTSWRF